MSFGTRHGYGSRCFALALMLGVAMAFSSCVGQIDFPEGINALRNAHDATYWTVYNINGTVTDEQGQPLQDIQVILTAKYINTPSAFFEKTDWPVDTVGSAADGSFSATNRQLICPYLEAVATDPAGQYQPDTMTVQTFATAQETDIVLPTISLKKK